MPKNAKKKNKSLSKYADDKIPKCEHCGNKSPCDYCSPEKVSVKVKDGTATASLPVGAKDHSEIWIMLKDRGFDPDEWEIVSLTVNQWEAPLKGQRGVQTLEQTKASLRQKPKFLGEFVKTIKDLNQTDGFSPQPRLKKSKDSTEFLVVLGDSQLPFANEILTELSHSFLQDTKPDGLIYIGDLIDFDNLSRFTPKPDFESTAQQGIEIGYKTLRDLKDSAGLKNGDKLIFLEGNHEFRLQKALLDRLPQLFGIKKADVGSEERSVLHLSNLMRFDEIGWHWASERADSYPHAEYSITDDLVATHGYVVRQKAGMSALASLDKMESSIIMGHTHRLAITHHTRWRKSEPKLYSAIETGTLADLSGLGYSKNPDWQGGFVTLEINNKTGSFHPELVIYDKNRITWRNYFWEKRAKGVKTNYESDS